MWTNDQVRIDPSLHDRAHPENVSTWLEAGGIVTIMGNTKPPRDPNNDDDDDAEDEDNDDESDDQPAVIREPEPDE